MPYSQEEILAKARELIPSEAILSRSRYVDGDDLLDGIKERVARAVYSCIEAPYYLAYLTGVKLQEDLATLSTAVSDVERCFGAMRAKPTSLIIDRDSFINEVESALYAESTSVMDYRAARISAQIKTVVARSNTKPTFDSVQATELLETSLGVLSSYLPDLRARLYFITQVLQRIEAADLLQWVKKRQLRKLIATLQAVENGETDSEAIVDLLITSSLLDTSTLQVDFSAYKYVGAVAPGAKPNRYTLAGTVPTGAYAIRKGDVLHTGNPANGFAINSYEGGILYLETASGPGAVSAYISPAAQVSYLAVRNALDNAVTLFLAAEKADFSSKASLVAYGNTGYPEYTTAKLAVISAIASAQAALSSFVVGLVPEVRQLIESVREERLFSVTDLLANLDFEGISSLEAESISLANSAKELLLQLSTQLGADEPSTFMSDSDPLYDELLQRGMK